MCTVREDMNKQNDEFEKTEDHLKALQNVGQIIGEVLKQLTEDKCWMRVPPVRVLNQILNSIVSHRQSIKRAPLCRWMPYRC